MRRFQEAYDRWSERRLTQEEAGRLLGVTERTFRRYVDRYEDGGLDALRDQRLLQPSHRKAPPEEVSDAVDAYRRTYDGWTAQHFFSHYYRPRGGSRGYTWVKARLQDAGLRKREKRKGTHRKRRDRAPMPGMMIHQDGSRHEWVPGQMWDLIVTMDDANSEQYAMFFVAEEGTQSSFQGIREVIEKKGLSCSFYSDRGSHYWHTPEAGGKVDKKSPTQFGRAMKHLGIEMIAAYSPEARGRSERFFRTHQDRLIKELALYGITTMEEANRYIRDSYLPAFNVEFMVEPTEPGSAFVEWGGPDLNDILCEQHERTVGNDNCVSFEGIKLQIPPDKYRCHYIKAKVRVHRYNDGSLGIFHGPRKLAVYDPTGNLIGNMLRAIA
jgi:transposase